MEIQQDENPKKKPRRGCKVRCRNRADHNTELIIRHLIEQGYGVIPLWGTTTGGECECGRASCSSKGKHPNPRYAPNGLNSAITDWRKAKEIIKKLPGANWGLATDGLVVIDVDAGRDGFETIEALFADQEDVPDTVLVQTGGLGVHIWYKAPPGVVIKNSVDQIGRGLDLRTSGGMIVIPPSLHASGRRYRFDDGCSPCDIDIAEMPSWLVEMIQQSANKPTTKGLGGGTNGIPEGKRNDTLTSVAGVLVNKGVGGESIFKGLQAINQSCCEPKLPVYEIKTIAASVCRYGGNTDTTDTLPPQEQFPLEVVPTPLMGFVLQAAEAMGCSPSMIVPHVLTSAAAAIGNARRIQLKEGWSEPAVLWIFTVAPSGSLKSPAQELAVKPAEIHQKLAMDAYQVALAKWRKLPPEEQRSEPEPKPKRTLVNDVTVESLAGILGHNPRGLLLYVDEGAGWLEGFNAYGGGAKGDEAKWLTVFGARPLIIDRKTGPEPLIFIPRATVSICGTTQPGTLARLMTQAHKDSGLAARLLLVQPDQRPKKWTEARIPAKELQLYIQGMRRLYSVEPQRLHSDGSYVPRDLKLTEEALEMWKQFYDEHNKEAVKLSGELSARWAKLEAYAARFALVLQHLFWAFSQGDAHAPLSIDAKSMAGGIRLAQWFAAETMRIHGVAVACSEADLRKHAINHIKHKGGKISASALSRSSSRYYPTKSAQAILDKLVASGCGRWEISKITKNGGRPSNVFVLTDQ